MAGESGAGPPLDDARLAHARLAQGHQPHPQDLLPADPPALGGLGGPHAALAAAIGVLAIGRGSGPVPSAATAHGARRYAGREKRGACGSVGTCRELCVACHAGRRRKYTRVPVAACSHGTASNRAAFQALPAAARPGQQAGSAVNSCGSDIQRAGSGAMRVRLAALTDRYQQRQHAHLPPPLEHLLPPDRTPEGPVARSGRCHTAAPLAAGPLCARAASAAAAAGSSRQQAAAWATSWTT